MYRILMIDDESSYHDLYKEIITEEFDVTIEFATDGLEGLQILEEKNDYDILILDLDMPRLDGHATIEEIKRNPNYKSLPIFILTANSCDQNQQVLLNMGADDFISKGCSPEIFISRLKNLIDYKKNLDLYHTSSFTYEKILDGIMAKVRQNLTKITGHLENLSMQDDIHIPHKVRDLNNYSAYVNNILDKIENPKRYINRIPISSQKLSCEFNQFRNLLFNNFQGPLLPAEGNESLNWKVDQDVFLLLLSEIISGYKIKCNDQITLEKGDMIFKVSKIAEYPLQKLKHIMNVAGIEDQLDHRNNNIALRELQ